MSDRDKNMKYFIGGNCSLLLQFQKKNFDEKQHILTYT